MTNSLLTRNFLIFFSRLFDSMKAQVFKDPFPLLSENCTVFFLPFLLQLGVERIGEIVTLLLQVIIVKRLGHAITFGM